MRSDKPISRTVGISLLALAVSALACATMPTVEQERRMARDISQQARREMNLLKDEVVERYITTSATPSSAPRGRRSSTSSSLWWRTTS